MRWIASVALCGAFIFACSNTSRSIFLDRDAVPPDDDSIVAEGDDLLPDEAVGDNQEPEDSEAPIAKDDAPATEHDIAGPDVADHDEPTPDEEEDGTEPDTTLDDAVILDDDVVVGWCGDGIVNGNETCDDGADNGTYGHCKSDCSGIGPHCGDGIVNGDETCDDGADNGTYNHCKSDCSGLGPHCGDGVVDAGFEECDKSNDQFCLGKAGGGGCSGNLYRLRSCDDITCTWNDWSGCGYSDGNNADNFGDCPPGFEC